MSIHKTTVCPYCKRSYLYDTLAPKIKCCGELLPSGFIKTARIVNAGRAPSMVSERLSKDQWLITYRAHWLRLHMLVHDIGEWTPRRAKEMYAAWVKTIPSFGCQCSEHWASITQMFPPPFTSPQAFAVWSWYTHNLVNLQLAKCQYDFRDYVVHYNAPAEWYDNYIDYIPQSAL